MVHYGQFFSFRIVTLKKHTFQFYPMENHLVIDSECFCSAATVLSNNYHYSFFSCPESATTFTFRTLRCPRHPQNLGCRGPREDGEARSPGLRGRQAGTGGCRCTAAQSGPSRLAPCASRRRCRRCRRCRTCGSVAAKREGMVFSIRRNARLLFRWWTAKGEQMSLKQIPKIIFRYKYFCCTKSRV